MTKGWTDASYLMCFQQPPVKHDNYNIVDERDDAINVDVQFDQWQHGKTLEKVGKGLRDSRHPTKVFDYSPIVDHTLHPLSSSEDYDNYDDYMCEYEE